MTNAYLMTFAHSGRLQAERVHEAGLGSLGVIC